MNQLILLHDVDGNSVAINVDIIGSCDRYNDTTYIFRKDDPRSLSWRVKETPEEIIAKQWGMPCSA